MRAVYLRVLIATVGGMALSGCLELGDETTIDLTAVGGGDGLSAATAFETPLVMPVGTNGGINDYLLAQPGFWKFNESQKQIDQGAAITLNNLVYDSTTDTWQLTAAGTPYDFTTGVTDVTDGTGTIKVGLDRFGTSSAKYGSFAFASFDDGTNVSFAAMYYGMLTTDLQTTGSGTFNGSFWGGATQTADQFAADGTPLAPVNYSYTASSAAAVTADFDAGTVTMTSSGPLTAVGGAPMNGSYDVTGVGIIAGNTYSGINATTATLWLPVVTVTPDPTDPINNPPTVAPILTADGNYVGDIAGAFYGPGGVETAGAVDATSTTATTNSFVGGYWAEREIFSPF